MPHALDSGDRKLLIGAGILFAVFLVVGTFFTAKDEGGQRASFPSSYSARWDGAKGAYLLLKDLGYDVERWEQSPIELVGDDEGESENEVLILAQPLQPASSEEKSAISEFIQKGGVVVAAGWGASQLLPQATPLSEGFPFGESVKFPALLPSPLVRGAPEISMIPPQRWLPKSASQLVVYGNDDTAAVITYSFGKGNVIWWGSCVPLTNAGIRESGNLALFLNSVGPASGRHVVWDEYFHGQHGSLWDYVARTPLPFGALQVGLMFLAILATYSRRQGPISTLQKSSRLSPLEFVETLGDLYSSAHAGSAAVRIAVQRLRFQLSRQLGLPTNAANADLAHGASVALQWNESEFSAMLARADRTMSAAKSNDTETLQIVQEILDYASRLELRRAQTTERQA
jgi:Domain of unknown function (DUF4350)